MPKAAAKSISFLDKFYRIIDALITAPLEESDTAYQHAKLLVSPASSQYKKIGASINFIASFLPGVNKAVSKYLLQSSKLPLPPGSFVLFNYGFGATVFRYQNASDDYAVKISRRSLGKNPAVQLEFCRQCIANFNCLCRWYNKRHSLAVSSHYLIVQSTVFNVPCVACIQALVQGVQEDLLRDYDDDQIVELAMQDPRLGEQLRDFIQATVTAVESEGLCLDFLGDKNVMLLNYGNRRTLVLLDHGVFDLSVLEKEQPEKLLRIKKDIERMKGLARRIA